MPLFFVLFSILKENNAQAFVNDNERNKVGLIQSDIIFVDSAEIVDDLNQPSVRNAREDFDSKFQPGVANKGGWNPIIRTHETLQRQPKQHSLEDLENDSASFHGWENPNLEPRTFGNAFRDLNAGQDAGESSGYSGNTAQLQQSSFGQHQPQLQATRRPRPIRFFGKKRPQRPSRFPPKQRPPSQGASSYSDNHRPQQSRPGQSSSGLQRMARQFRFMIDGMMIGLSRLFKRQGNQRPRRPGKRPRKTRRPILGAGYNAPNLENSGSNEQSLSHQGNQITGNAGSYTLPSSTSTSYTNPSNTLSTNTHYSPPISGNQPHFHSEPSLTPITTYSSFQADDETSIYVSSTSSSSNTNVAPTTYHTANINPLTTNVYSTSDSSNGSHLVPGFLGSQTISNAHNPSQTTPVTTSSNSYSFSSSNTFGRTRHEPCFNCNKNSGSGTGVTLLSTKNLSPVTSSGIGSFRPTREISEKKKEMFELRMAWYHYHQKLKDFEAKYNKEDEDLARFRKEIAETSTSNFPFLIGLKSPQLVEDVDFSESVSTPLATNLFSTGSKTPLENSDHPTTVHSSYVGGLLQTVIDPYKGTIGPGFTYSSTPLYPKEIEDSFPDDSVEHKAITNPFTRKPKSFPQTRPKVFLSSYQHDHAPDEDASLTQRNFEVFDLKKSSQKKYPNILTPRETLKNRTLSKISDN